MGIYDTIKDLPPEKHAQALAQMKERAMQRYDLQGNPLVYDFATSTWVDAPKVGKAKPVEVAKAVLAQAEAKPPRPRKKAVAPTQKEPTQKSERGRPKLALSADEMAKRKREQAKERDARRRERNRKP